VGPVNLILWVGGAILMWIGYARARGPWARYQDLKAQDANVARYEAWRGGIREDTGPTGASVAMAILRRQVQVGAGIGVAGLIAIVAGFVIH
jgi:threonine/homoserine/homoserine lactone efflux protein